jgi:predicted peptidase
MLKQNNMYLKNILLMLIGLILITQTGLSQELRFDAQQYVSEGDTLNYRISFPDFSGSQSYPVVIFLHGGGERGDDNVSQLKWGVQNFATDQVMMTYKPIVIAPQMPEEASWSNFTGQFEDEDEPLRLADTPSRPLEMTMEVLDQVIENSSVDTTRIYITGMSMGGYGTWDAIARWPDRFAAAVPVCGGGDPTTANRIAEVPVWAFHGADDTVVVPEESRKMITALREAGANPGYTEYPGVGHFSWLQTYKDKYMMAWLFSQRNTDGK